MSLEGGPSIREQQKFGFNDGDHVVIRKIQIKEGQQSDLGANNVYGGHLRGAVTEGKPVFLDSGMNTSSVRRIQRTSERLVVETETSVYEIVPAFRGLELSTEVGTIRLPDDAKMECLPPGTAPSVDLTSNGMQLKIQIDRDALNKVLISTRGAVVHKLNDRYVVLARVGNAHVPFYRSSKGTQGKRQGEWYPFFGNTGTWIIKGESISSDGDMHYHPALTNVQNLLNKHLVLPDAKYLNKNFEIRKTDGELFYSLGTEIPMEDFASSSFWKDTVLEPHQAERAYVESLSGYAPRALDGHHPSEPVPRGKEMVKEWINDVVQAATKSRQ